MKFLKIIAAGLAGLIFGYELGMLIVFAFPFYFSEDSAFGCLFLSMFFGLIGGILLMCYQLFKITALQSRHIYFLKIISGGTLGCFVGIASIWWTMLCILRSEPPHYLFYHYFLYSAMLIGLISGIVLTRYCLIQKKIHTLKIALISILGAWFGADIAWTIGICWFSDYSYDIITTYLCSVLLIVLAIGIKYWLQRKK